MAADRIVVGAIGDDAAARTSARGLRDAGYEIVFVGGDQSPRQLAATAVAEDAVRVVIDGDSSARQQVQQALADVGADDIVVESVV